MQGDLFRLYFRLLLSDALEGRTVNAIDQQTVEISTPAGEAAQLTVDPATGLPVRVRYDAVHVAGAPVSVEESWSYFRDVGGVKIPFKTALARNGQKYADVTMTDCKINSGLKIEELQKRP